MSTSIVHSDRSTGRVFLLLLGGLLLGSFPLIAVGTQSFFVRDFAVFGYPLAHFHKASFWSGHFPLWNPLNHCGIPHFAQWNTLILYPGSLLYLLFPLPWSLNVFCLAHQFLGGAGMYRLTHSLTRDGSAAAMAGIAYAFAGLTLNSLMWPNNIAALGWLPWILWIVQQAGREGGPRIPIATLMGACQMLTGAPEIILVTWIFAGTLLLADFDSAGDGSAPPRERLQPFARCSLIVVLIALVAAVQLLPFFELLAFADRAGNGDSTGWSASPTCWVNFLLPGYQGVRTELGFPINHFQKWTLSFYPGMLTLVCAAFAFSRRNRLPLLLACLSVAGLALASGHYSAAYRWLSQFLPLDLMRFPVKFVLFPVVALPLLAGIGWSRLASVSRRRIVAVALVISGLFALAAFLDQSSHTARPERPGKWMETALRGGFLLLAIGGVLIARSQRWSKHRWASLGIPLLILWADLRWHMPDMIASVESTAYSVREPALSDPPERLLPTVNAWSQLYANDSPKAEDLVQTHVRGRTALLNLIHGEAKVGGFLSLTPPTERETKQTFEGDDWKSVNPRMADFVGVSRLGRWREDISWEIRETAAPLITAGQTPTFGNSYELFDRMRSADFDPFKEVCLGPDTKTFAVPTNLTSPQITMELFSTHEIRFRADSSGPNLAVIAQTWYPAWQASVNGQATPLLRANLQFQAVALPAGESVVVLRYEDRAFRIGLVLSLIGLALTALLWWRSCKNATSARPTHDDSAGVGEGQRLVGGE